MSKVSGNYVHLVKRYIFTNVSSSFGFLKKSILLLRKKNCKILSLSLGKFTSRRLPYNITILRVTFRNFTKFIWYREITDSSLIWPDFSVISRKLISLFTDNLGLNLNTVIFPNIRYPQNCINFIPTFFPISFEALVVRGPPENDDFRQIVKRRYLSKKKFCQKKIIF